MSMINLVTITRCTYAEVKKALEQWIQLYQDSLPEGLTFKLAEMNNATLIVADDRLDNVHFSFLVNYLTYPEGIDYAEVTGFTEVTDSDFFPKEYLNKKLLVFIPENDEDYDNVHVTTEDNESFKIDFGNKLTKLPQERPFLPFETNDIRLQNYELLKVEKAVQQPGETKIRKRFNIVSLLAILLSVGSGLLWDKFDEGESVYFIVNVAIYSWLAMDYKILRYPGFYYQALVFAIAIAAFGLSIYSKTDMNALDYHFVFPLFLLLTQKPLRFLFQRIIKREPVVISKVMDDREYKEIPKYKAFDFIYTALLWFLPLILLHFVWKFITM